ncbi:oligosaccharide flippase family protein [Aeromicrobium sp. CF4.19]|uniref:oligosaccharide flippase family protein n=1 Tax=Aeromicrobium sp. CF4.19 TaxID=3373082 RepID=UPI003EE74A50
MSEVWRPGAPAPRQIRDRFAFLLIVGATFGLQALTLVTGIIIARTLGVEGRGTVALVFALGLLASQLTFGGSPPIALAKNLAERQVAARDGLRGIVRRRAVLLLPPSLAVAALFLLMDGGDPGTQTWVLAGAVGVMALQTMIFRLLAGGLQGERRILSMAWVSVMPQLLFAVALSVAWVAGWGWDVMDMLVAYFVSCLVGIVLSFACLARPTHRVADRLDESTLWQESRRSYLSSVRPLDGLGLDRVVVGGAMSLSALGLYSAATAVSNLCSLVSNAVAVVVLPRVALHHDEPVKQAAVIRRWLLISVGLVVTTVAMLQVLVEPIIRLAFGTEFVGAVECARWLIVADGLMAVRKVMIAMLQGQGRGAAASWVELALLPLMLAGIVTAAAVGSLVGVGVALTAVGVLACSALGWLVAGGGRRVSS